MKGGESRGRDITWELGGREGGGSDKGTDSQSEIRAELDTGGIGEMG